MLVRGMRRRQVEHCVLEGNFQLQRDFFEGESSEERFFEVGFLFFEVARDFDLVTLDDAGDLNVEVLIVDGGLDEVVKVERRAAVGATVVLVDVLDVVESRLHASPGRLVGH